MVVQLLARDSGIPRPLRWLAVIAALPVPGPLDEAVFLVVAGLLWVFYRERLTEAWARADGPHFEDSRAGNPRSGLTP